MPQLRTRRAVERQLLAAGLSSLSLRLAPFTEVWPALVGGSLPLRGEDHPTLGRPYRFLRAFRRITGRTVEDRGVLVVPGDPSHRNAFISVHDVAAALVGAVDDELEGAVDVGGPQALSWQDLAEVFAAVLHRPVRVVSVPAAVFGPAQRLLTPLAPAAADIMGMNRVTAVLETSWNTSAVTDRLIGWPLRTVQQVLRDKALAPLRRVTALGARSKRTRPAAGQRAGDAKARDLQQPLDNSTIAQSLRPSTMRPEQAAQRLCSDLLRRRRSARAPLSGPGLVLGL